MGSTGRRGRARRPATPGLWVLEQPGDRRVRTSAAGTIIDISSGGLLGAEQGLLGIAFHPDFASGSAFLHWSDRRGDTRVAEFRERGARP